MISRDDWRCIILTLVLVFVAHATAYLTHEYSHAITAWLLGWMRRPLEIDYGGLTLSNILFQQAIGDGVDYGPIFASGHGLQAALIAFSGPGIGNGALYAACFVLLRRAAIRARPVMAMFLFWLAVMSAGNVWSYAPVRTVTTHADMAFLARGLGLSPWQLLPLVTMPSLVVTMSFFFSLLPRARRTFFARGPVVDTFNVVLACSFYFGFFGSAGLDNRYGEIPALCSIVSMFMLFPLVTISCLFSGSQRPFGNGLR